MYRRALRTGLSSEKPRAKIGSGCAFVRPASSIHFAEPQSDCCEQAGLEARGRAPAGRLAGAVPHAHLPHGGLARGQRITAVDDVGRLVGGDLAGLPQVRAGGELRLGGRDADLVRRLQRGAAGAAELPAEVRRAVADAQRLRQRVRLERARAQRGLRRGRRRSTRRRCYGSQRDTAPARLTVEVGALRPFSLLTWSNETDIDQRATLFSALMRSRPGKSLGLGATTT